MASDAGRPVLDASALLAAINREPGGEQVLARLRTGGVMSAVNLAEVVSRLVDLGADVTEVEADIGALRLDVVSLDRAAAYANGRLRAATRSGGLSLADRACLELAGRLGTTALTADRRWAELDLDVPVELIR